MVKYKNILLLILITISFNSFAQLPDSCKLEIGTNLSGLADWGTEIPFVDMMRTCRTWYTKANGDPNDPFNSGFASKLKYRSDGYPTHIPQNVAGSEYTQDIATIWAITDGWTSGRYTVLWDGDGEFVFWGSYENLTKTSDHRITFDFPEPKGGVLELRITYSNINNPIHNIRILMPGTEYTYLENPFNQVWIDKISVFKTFRFMDWGQTNSWGIEKGDDIKDTTLVNWNGRSKVDYYTWTHSKGVPYEMMIKLMNIYGKDGWICVPHSASEDYIRKMARFFRDDLNGDRHIYVEYSNEIWNWIFPQTQWVNYHGCEATGESWPEGTVKFIQRMLDYWTDEFKNDLHRTTRIVGVFTGWLDVAQRVAFNVDTNSFDAIAPTYYFHLSEGLESQLDDLGANAKVKDVARFARLSMPEAYNSIKDIKYELADVINKPLAFYEGGQHLTPHPFGIQPSYDQALLDIQRDTAMYNLYNEWFDKLRLLQEGDESLLLMNFAFVKARNARYGSWGILETMDQDISIVPAPKYKAIIENMNSNCGNCSSKESITIKTCDKYFWNGKALLESGVYLDTFTNISGCDSIVELNLYIEKLNTTISKNDTLLICDELDASYQWVDCNDYSPIKNATNRFYVVRKNGSYAVIVTKSNCVDTSECINISTISNAEYLLYNEVQVYPIPSNGIINIELGSLKDAKVKIVNINGQTIFSKNDIDVSIYSFSIGQKLGIYILEVYNDFFIKRYKLVVE